MSLITKQAAVEKSESGKEAPLLGLECQKVHPSAGTNFPALYSLWQVYKVIF